MFHTVYSSPYRIRTPVSPLSTLSAARHARIRDRLVHQAVDHVSVHIGKASLNAVVIERKPFVIEPQ